MQVVRVLNNSSLLAKDEQHRQFLLIKKGLAFGKKVNDSIQEEDVSQAETYYLPDEPYSRKLVEAVDEFSLELFELVSTIIVMCETKRQRSYEKKLLLSLLEHIDYAVQLAKEGSFVSFKLLWEIKKFYPEEYQLGKQALEMIEEAFDVQLPEDEAGFIAFYLIRSKTESKLEQAYLSKSLTLLEGILAEITTFVKEELPMSSIENYRLLTHLQFLVRRLLKDKPRKVAKQSDKLFCLLSEAYPEVTVCIKNIVSYLQGTIGGTLTMNEQTYLMLHIIKLQELES